MAITSSCSNGLLATAVLAAMLLPVQYYLPDLHKTEQPLVDTDQFQSSHIPELWYDPRFTLSSFDLIVSMALVLVGILTYFCEWIQSKIMERRLIKLNQFLLVSLERLRALDAQQEQLESSLKMVQHATSEYNLLLYLLLRRQRLVGQNSPPTNFEKEFQETRAF